MLCLGLTAAELQVFHVSSRLLISCAVVQASSGIAAPESSSNRPGTAPGAYSEAEAQSAVERRTASTSAIAASPFAGARGDPGNGTSVQRTGSPSHGEDAAQNPTHPTVLISRNNLHVLLGCEQEQAVLLVHRQCANDAFSNQCSSTTSILDSKIEHPVVCNIRVQQACCLQVLAFLRSQWRPSCTACPAAR